MVLVLLFIIPLGVSLGAFFLLHATVTWKEFLLQLGAGVLATIVGWQVAKWGALRDTENWNGRITEKVDGTQSCCHCRDVCTSHNKDGSCRSSQRVCDHFRDYYWSLETTVGRIPIKDCSGWDNPPDEWTNAKVGEPASVENGYTNYLLADPDSLMVHAQMERYVDRIPEYPRVHSHYKVNHVVGDVPAPPELQDAIREINADLGSGNQVDVTVVLTSDVDPTYAQALEAKWLYGPKNSLNIVMGIDRGTIRWVRVVSFSKVEMLKVRLRDQLQTLALSDPEVPKVIRQEVARGFKRTAMAEFEYLASTATPRGWHLALLIFLEVLLGLFLTYVMHRHDVFGDERAARSYGFRKPNWR